MIDHTDGALRFRLPSVSSSIVEKRHGPDRACRAAGEPQGKADEAEAALPHQLVQVPKAFDVSDAALCTGKVGLEVGLTLGGGTNRLDAKHENSLVRQPVHRIDVQARKIVQVAGRSKQARVD